jgi:hypothetical protein
MRDEDEVRRMKKIQNPKFLFVALVLIVFVLSLLPGLGSVSGPWPGFFYSPFYTTNIFSDVTTPAYQAGLRPEDRVIQAGALPGQWPRIASLEKETSLAAQSNRPLTLVYELGRDLAAISVQVEPLDWWRWLEKAGPLFLSGLLLAGLSLSSRFISIPQQVFAGFAALPLLAAPDYFLNPGHGLESGFVPFSAESWLTASGKWSTFLYAPLWKLAIGAGAIYALSQLWPQPSRLKRIGAALIISGLALDLISYIYEASRTALYNNPDYMVWHGRGAFWPEWIGLGVLLIVSESRRLARKGLLPLVGFGLFLGGFIIPTTFDMALPGPGPQWYSLGLVLFFGAGAVAVFKKKEIFN